MSWHVPSPSHVSGLSHSVSAGSPQVVPPDFGDQAVWLIDSLHSSHSLPGFTVPWAMHSPPIRQNPELMRLEHVSPSSMHKSVVQVISSSQVSPEPTQLPSPSHTSVSVQKRRSSHVSVLFVCWQLSTGSHQSSVHTFTSSQSMSSPGMHSPSVHSSPCVQTLSSVHSVPSSSSTMLQSPESGSHVFFAHSVSPESSHSTTVSGSVLQKLSSSQM